MFVHILDEANHVVRLCFTENVLAVGFNSSFADAQVDGDLFVAEFAFNKADDFQFSFGKGRTIACCFSGFQLLFFHKTIRLSNKG